MDPPESPPISSDPPDPASPSDSTNSTDSRPVPEIPHREWSISNCIINLQMQVPPGVDPTWYFHISYPEYGYVLTRPYPPPPLNVKSLIPATMEERRQILSAYTDHELLETLSMVPPYSNRTELIVTLAERISLPGFFIPLTRRCYNDRTILLSETQDSAVPLIGYGTVFRYRGYEVDEFLGAFYPEGSPGGPIMYRYPDRPQCVWSHHDIRDLYRLLPYFPNTDKLAQHLYQSFLRDPEAGTTELLNTFLNMSDQQKSAIETWLDCLFETAMYMRRWPGPGHPYPIQAHQTHSEEVPDIQVSQGLIKLNDLMEAADYITRKFLQDLREIRHYQTTLILGRYVVTKMPLLQILERIQQGDECIRMASSDLLITANYYRELLFGSGFAYFDLTELQHIT
jgi:hypothetical protein